MAKQLWLQATLPSYASGDKALNLAGVASFWNPLKLAEMRGIDTSGTQTVQAGSVAGPTNGIEVQSITNVACEWITEPLSADFTIAGTITANFWCCENTMTDNCAANFVVDKIDAATGAITQVAKSARTTEVASLNPTASLESFTATPTSTAFKRGDRIRVRVFADDAGTMGAGGAMLLFYNRSTASVAGDSWIQFTENLTFESQLPGGGIEQWISAADLVIGDAAADTRQSQPFIAAATTIYQVDLRLFKVGAPTDNLIIEIQTDSGGNPSGTVVGTIATVGGATLTTTVADFSYNPAITGMTVGSTYHLVFRRSGALDAANYYKSRRQAAATAGYLGYRTYNGSVWTELIQVPIMFRIWGTQVSTYYLTDTAEAAITGSALEKKATTARGSSSVNSVTNSVAGPATPIQLTATGGGTVIEWYTPPLVGFTLGGRALLYVWAFESVVGVNANVRGEIAICNGDGSGAVVWGKNCGPDEITTTPGAIRQVSIAGDDTTVTTDKRLRFRIFIDDTTSNVSMGAGTVTVSYNGPTAAAAGDTYVILPNLVTENIVGANTPVQLDATTTLTSALTFTKTRAVSIAASTAISPALTKGVKYFRSITATLSLAAVLVRSPFNSLRSLPLTITLTPTLVRIYGAFRTANATTTVTPALTKNKAAPRTLAVTAILTPTLVRVVQFFRAVAATTTLTPTMTRAPFFPRLMAVVATFTPTISKKYSGVRAVAVTAILTPTLTLNKVLSKTAAATTTITAVMVRVAQYPRTIAASMTLTPTLVKKLFALKTIAATVTFIPTQVKQMYKTISTGVTLTPTMTQGKAYSRTLAVTATITAVLARVVNYFRAPAVTVTLTPTLTKVLQAPRAIAATVAMTPALVKKYLGYRTLAATTTLVPGMNRLFSRTFAVTMTMTASMTKTIALLKTMSVGVTFTPSLSKVFTSAGPGTNTPITLAVTVTFTPTLARKQSYVRTIAVAPVFTASISKLMKLSQAVPATVTMIPNMVRVALRLKSVPATTTVTPTMTKVSGPQKTIAVVATFVPVLSRRLLALRTIAASVVLTPTLAPRVLAGRLLAASTTIVASLVPIAKRYRTLAATTVLTPAVTFLSGKGKVLNATVTLVPSLKKLVGKSLSVTANFIANIQKKSTTNMAVVVTFTPTVQTQSRFVRRFDSVAVLQVGLTKGTKQVISLSVPVPLIAKMTVGRVNRIIVSASATFEALMGFARFLARKSIDVLFSTRLSAPELLSAQHEVEEADLLAVNEEVAVLLSANTENSELGSAGTESANLRSVT